MKKLSHLIEQDNRLYREVNQLRTKLFLTHSSFLFQCVSVIMQTYNDLAHLFPKDNKKQLSEIAEKKQSIQKLKKQKGILFALSKSPYMWIIHLIFFILRSKTHSIPKNDSKHKTMFIFGSSPLAHTQSRSVHIARIFSKKQKCVYIENVFDESKKLGFRIVSQEKNLTVVRISAKESFHITYQLPSLENKKIIRSSINLLAAAFPDCAITYYIHHPFWYFVLPKNINTLWYDKSIDYAHFHNATKQILKIEKQIIRITQKITSSNVHFFHKRKSVKIIPNTVDDKIFKSASKSIDTCSVGLCWIKKPVVGYIGTLDERIDGQLIARLAESFPTLSFVLVGNTDYRPIIDVAEKHKNIFPVGEKEYLELPKYIQSFDILILPYKQIKNAVLSHLELPLYFISGKPIVATVAVDMQQYKKCVYLPNSPSDWCRKLDEALKEKKRNKKKYLRLAIAKKMVD